MNLSIAKLIVIVSITVFCFSSSSLKAGQKVVVGRVVAANQQVSMDRIEHDLWHRLVQKYVNEKGQVNYKSWNATAEDIEALDQYLNSLSAANTSVAAARSAKLAFWINAYNAVTVKGILREYPTSSIRNHTARLFGYNIWNDLLLVVGDSQVSLNQMEHDILRKMGEPRIHFAIVCASHSCPRLLNQAYTTSQLENQLVSNSKNFFANPENFRFDRNSRRFWLSSILKWFKEDFGIDQADQLRFIAPYLPEREAQNAAVSNSINVTYLSYDWSLNEQLETQNSRH